jgi:hypothetical protein
MIKEQTDIRKVTRNKDKTMRAMGRRKDGRGKDSMLEKTGKVGETGDQASKGIQKSRHKKRSCEKAELT